MTTENNNSANALIAEFMGMKPHDPKELDGFWTNTIKAHKFDNVMNLQFNSDWNWLMEVVEKIESIGFTFETKKNWARITRKGENIILRWEEDKTKIEAVYNACIEFIKWYNENKIQTSLKNNLD